MTSWAQQALKYSDSALGDGLAMGPAEQELRIQPVQEEVASSLTPLCPLKVPGPCTADPKNQG